jgi:hypothetical protein
MTAFPQRGVGGEQPLLALQDWGSLLPAFRRALLLAEFWARFQIIFLLFVATAAHAAPLTPVTRPLTLPKGHGELAAGYRNSFGNYAYNLDGSAIQGSQLVPFRSYRDQSAVLAGAYGVTSTWELSFEVPYTWRTFDIERSPLVDTEGRLITSYPESRTHGLGDARFATTFALTPSWGAKLAWKTASGADNFFPTTDPDARPTKYIGSGQSDLTLLVLAQRQFAWSTFGARLSGEAGYRRRLSGISNYLLRDYKPADELLVNGSALFQLGRFGGAGLGFAYMHEASATSVSVLRGSLPFWLAAGDFEFRASTWLPVYGKDYPALFPEQLAERQPLLGPEFEALVVYRWGQP